MQSLASQSLASQLRDTTRDLLIEIADDEVSRDLQGIVKRICIILQLAKDVDPRCKNVKARCQHVTVSCITIVRQTHMIFIYIYIYIYILYAYTSYIMYICIYTVHTSWWSVQHGGSVEQSFHILLLICTVEEALGMACGPQDMECTVYVQS